MPRPRKCRHVCCMPECNRFGPLNMDPNRQPYVTMSIDEYETIRLIDLEGLNQEACAIQMKVARTTVQMIYNDARKKLAEALVNGRALHIEGGDYMLCGENPKPCCTKECHRKD